MDFSYYLDDAQFTMGPTRLGDKRAAILFEMVSLLDIGREHVPLQNATEVLDFFFYMLTQVRNLIRKHKVGTWRSPRGADHIAMFVRRVRLICSTKDASAGAILEMLSAPLVVVPFDALEVRWQPLFILFKYQEDAKRSLEELIRARQTADQ